jgi:hypothetical protein
MGRFKNTNALPLGVALQALALFVAAFFMGPGSATSPEVTGVGGNAANTPGALTSLTELPRDLMREMLPVPRVPERENRNEPPQPTPADEGTDSLISGGTKLASLRTSSVSLSGLVAIPISAPMLGVPDSLNGLSLAGGSWLGGGSNSARRRGSRRGGGPSDMGGGGSGMGGGSGGGGGGYCPTPGQVGGGGRSRGGRGGGGAVSAGTGRPRGGSGSGATGTSSGGSRGRPAGGGAARGKGGKS